MYSYTLRPMESNSLKCSSIQRIHSIDLKFGMYIIVLPIVLILVNKGLIVFFYRSTKKNSYTLQPMKSNYKKYASV